MTKTAFDELWAWDDTALAASLAWYRAVAANRMPAKFVIAATIPAPDPTDDIPQAELWAELDRLTPVFLERRREIRDHGAALGPVVKGASLLHLCNALAGRMLAHCDFCHHWIRHGWSLV